MKKYFPWRLYRRFFLDILLAVFLSIACAWGLAYFFFPDNSTAPFVLFIVFILLGSLWLAYRFTVPLKRVILKALRLASKKLVADYSLESDVDLFDHEPGEYFELEQALEKIRKKLRKRRLQLSHEREESKALMSALEDAVVSVSKEEKLVFFNSAFATLFLSREQLHSSQGPLGLALQQVLRDPEIHQQFTHSLKTGQTVKLQKKIATQFQTQGRFFSVTISPLKEEKSEIVYAVLGLFHDITDIKRAEQIRIEFVENASHELRTPLTAVKGFAETLKEDLALGRVGQADYFLQIMIKNVDRLTDLVQDMMTISSLENTSTLDLEEVNPELLTQDAVERLAPLASQKSILIKTQCTVSDFFADAAKLDQVLNNLVSNAIKYIPNHGQIEIFWVETADSVELHVKDNGPGIAEEHQARLFERFYRVDKARNRDVGGTGLGLSIVKHIVQAHGGNAAVKSSVGFGSEFICSFPKRHP